MSDDLIILVKSLIESGQGDTERLRLILIKLQTGNPLHESDQNYLHDLAKISEPEDLGTPISYPSPETASPKINNPEESIQDSQNSMDVSPQEASGSSSKPPSRKKVATVISIIAIIAIAYAGLDVYAVNMLQFRPHHGNQYLLSQTQLFIQSDVCNPSYFPASFNKYEINAFYKTYSIETAEISGSTISPKTYEILNGVFTLNKDAVIKLQTGNFTFDPSQAHVTTTIDAPIFGVIPFSVSKEYTGADFQQVVKNGVPGSFSC
ncbi:Uncharacterised protein [uncultured archaeon]|nr:Uncharacterised protein [uncultured archaeon]